MRTTDPGDAARIELLLAELRLPAVKQVGVSLAAGDAWLLLPSAGSSDGDHREEPPGSSQCAESARSG